MGGPRWPGIHTVPRQIDAPATSIQNLSQALFGTCSK